MFNFDDASYNVECLSIDDPTLTYHHPQYIGRKFCWGWEREG